jgi:hypothetical protein
VNTARAGSPLLRRSSGVRCVRRALACLYVCLSGAGLSLQAVFYEPRRRKHLLLLLLPPLRRRAMPAASRACDVGATFPVAAARVGSALAEAAVGSTAGVMTACV